MTFVLHFTGATKPTFLNKKAQIPKRIIPSWSFNTFKGTSQKFSFAQSHRFAQAQRGNLGVMAMASPTGSLSVSDRMANVKKSGKIAFIPFLIACDPNPETTIEAIKQLDALGADVIELGVPYSDPLADGPTIQAAATRALQQGTTLDRVLDVVKQASPSITAPIVLFTYYNPIMARGLDKFCTQVKAAGGAGLLVPDIPLEETDEIRQVASQHGLELVLLTTPTTPVPRMKKIAESSQGFVYLVSVTGVTGVRGTMEVRVEGLIETLKATTDKSVAVGFGVSGPEQAKQIKEWGADGVIVGSALVKALGEAESPQTGLKNMIALARSIRESI